MADSGERVESGDLTEQAKANEQRHQPPPKYQGLRMFVRNKAAVFGAFLMIGILFITYVLPIFITRNKLEIIADKHLSPGSTGAPAFRHGLPRTGRRNRGHERRKHHSEGRSIRRARDRRDRRNNWRTCRILRGLGRQHPDANYRVLPGAARLAVRDRGRGAVHCEHDHDRPRDRDRVLARHRQADAGRVPQAEEPRVRKGRQSHRGIRHGGSWLEPFCRTHCR